MSTTRAHLCKASDIGQVPVTHHKPGGDVGEQESRSAQSAPTCGVLGGGFACCSVQESERRGFAVKLTAKYVDEFLDLVQLQNVGPMVTLFVRTEECECTRCDSSVRSSGTRVVQTCVFITEPPVAANSDCSRNSVDHDARGAAHFVRGGSFPLSEDLEPCCRSD